MSSISDPIGDFLTRLRNAAYAQKPEAVAPFSKMLGEISRILKEEGFIADYRTSLDGGFRKIHVQLKYTSGRCVITDLKRVSRPGLRKYVGASTIPRVLSGVGISILSTSSGVLSSRVAKSRNIGGELLAFVW
jgi:small subunit ribosomal protein S8